MKHNFRLIEKFVCGGITCTAQKLFDNLLFTNCIFRCQMQQEYPLHDHAFCQDFLMDWKARRGRGVENLLGHLHLRHLIKHLWIF